MELYLPRVDIVFEIDNGVLTERVYYLISIEEYSIIVFFVRYYGFPRNRLLPNCILDSHRPLTPQLKCHILNILGC